MARWFRLSSQIQFMWASLMNQEINRCNILFSLFTAKLLLNHYHTGVDLQVNYM